MTVAPDGPTDGTDARPDAPLGLRRRALLRGLGPLALGGALAGCSGDGGAGEPATPAGEPTAETGQPSSAAGGTAGALSHLAGLSGTTAPDVAVEGVHERTFAQTVDGRETTLDVDVPVGLYRYYHRRTRAGAYGAYVADTYDDAYVSRVAGYFADYGREEGLSRDEVLDHVIGFVQGLEYATDVVGTGFDEYPKYPVETLVDEGGDCEDTSILLASIAEALGYGVVLLAFPDANHMALGVAGEDLPGTYYEHEGRRYHYLETTGQGWAVGQVPDSVGSARAHFMPVDASPVLVMAWESGVGPDGEVRFEVLVRNVGDAPAGAASVQVDLQDEDGAVVSRVRTEPVAVPLDRDRRLRTALPAPANRPLRARVALLVDGSLHDVQASEYRSPGTGG